MLGEGQRSRHGEVGIRDRRISYCGHESEVPGMRLIDADALKIYEQLEPMGNGNYKSVLIVYKKDIEAAPTIEPVKQGRLEWRKEKTIWQTGYYCSECQAFFGKDYDMVKYFNYCPNCGARMSEGSEE